MRKQKTEKAVVLFCLAAMCFWSPFLQETKAEDAFVVEENAIIGGESPSESAPGPAPAFPAPHQEEVSQEGISPEKSPKEGSLRSEAPEKPRDDETLPPEKEEMKRQSDHTISQNSTTRVFRIPVRRPDAEKDATQEDWAIKAEETSEQETETKTEEMPQEGSPWWLLAAGGIFFLGGCVRILWRIKGRKGQ